MDELPTMRVEPGVEVKAQSGEALEPIVGIEPAEVVETATPMDNAPDDIVYVTITVPVSRKPLGRLSDRCDLRNMRGRHKSIARQIYDGYDRTLGRLNNGAEIRTQGRAVLKMFELLDAELKRMFPSD